MTSDQGQFPCPVCGKVVEPECPTRPFCSRRCKLIDLGNWLDGRYHIPVDEDCEPEG